MEPRAFAYLNDIVVLGKTFDEHLANLREVLHRLLAANLKINPDKCHFARPSLRYLEHIVDHEGLRTDPEKVKTILEIPPPTNIAVLRRFLGIVSWYRRFIPNVATTTGPLNELLKKKSR